MGSSPSEQPSSIPSVQPTGQPSSIPSSQPSCTPSSSPSDYATAHLFYPDWSSGGSGCKNDSKEPSYMAANPSYYMSTTLLKCCTTYFGWNYDVCMGNERGVCKRALWYPDWEGCEGASASAGAVGDNLWYKRSADWVCVQDCTLTGGVCGGVRSSWETSTYATRAKCCASIPYDKDCNTRTISVLT